MDRRQFLKLGGFLTVSVATTGLAGCGGGDGDSTDYTPDPSLPSTPPATGPGWKFPQSVASGDPRPDGILLWTRVVPAGADDVTSVADGNFTIRLLVTDADNAAALGSNTALTGTAVVDTGLPVYATFDHTVRHKIIGLAPGRTYYYQFIAGDVRSRVGRFKTAPAVDADLAQLRFAFMSCQDWSINHWGAFEHIVASNENLDFIVHLGDYIYETVGEAFQTGAVESRHPLLQLPNGAFKNGVSGARYAVSLADYRYLYKRYRTDSRLQALHERYPLIAVWDDHEFSDDAWRDAETYSHGSYNTSTGGDNNHQLSRRRSANQAWFEFMPADVSYASATPGYENIQIYRELRFGRLAHLVMTDQRLYRADHMVPEAAPNPLTGQPLGSIGSRYMVPENILYGAEAQKMAAATQLGSPDPLAFVAMLGKPQRDWWKNVMASSNATWKLWGNEVSLLRMGVDGTTAIATLIALSSVPTLATQIANAASQTSGNIAVASALVGAVTAGASQDTAALAARSIAEAAASGANKVSVAMAAGLNASQAGVAAAAFDAAQAAAIGGSSAQAAAGAQVVAFGAVKADIQARGAESSYIPTDKRALLSAFFTKFLLNADQWDGYDAERRDLMQHLKGNNIKNVVALTGDIHAFFTGTVHDNYRAAGNGTPVMVDLVTAGISSDSFFSYLRDAVGTLSSDLAPLVFYPLTIPVPGLGSIQITFNLLDFSMSRLPPSLDELADQARVQVRGALATKGLPESQLDATTRAVLEGLKAEPAFNTTLLGLARALAGMNSNPWLKLTLTDAQGYAVVNLTQTQLTCEFRQVNKLVGNSAPSNIIARTLFATVPRDSASVTVGEPRTLV
ncbi:alkaline phosphatase D family protein [Chitinimonas lacunae]|uniref:Alkaline phosphatase D family protein n=1 Tax=Chitinimonas lacunae TaxID=1963018 RepID=A0ABV8MNH3_9NEIS